VRNILTNVITTLSNHTENTQYQKKFTWCETSFLHKFWNDAEVNQELKTNFTTLLKEGHIQIVGGGWVQHDEALTNYKM